MLTVTKRELIDRIADSTHQRRVEVKRTIQTFLDQVIVELSKGNRLELRDFGVFEIKQRAPRTAHNPKTLVRVAVPVLNRSCRCHDRFPECLYCPPAAVTAAPPPMRWAPQVT